MGSRRMSARKKQKRRAHKEKRLAQEQIATGEEDKNQKSGSTRSSQPR